jgi:hypothetical protein
VTKTCFLGFHNWKLKYVQKGSCDAREFCVRCGQARGAVLTKHRWQKKFTEVGKCEMQEICDRCGANRGPKVLNHEWGWKDKTSCLQKQICKRCGAEGGINEKLHTWEWHYSVPNAFIRNEVCKKCGAIGRTDDTGKQKWSCIYENIGRGQKYLQLQQAIRDLRLSKGIWSVDASESQWDRKGSLMNIVSRSDLSIHDLTLDFTNISISIVKVKSGYLFFYPDKISLIEDPFPINKPLLIKSSCSYCDFHAELTNSQFTETGDNFPGDAEVINNSWLYSRVDGGPDRRHINNRRIPTLNYGKIKLSMLSTTWIFLISNMVHARKFVTALSEYIGDWQSKEPPHTDDQNRSKRKQSHNTQAPPSANSNNSYEILGVKPGATIQEITVAYHKLARENHPDRVSGLDNEFKELAERRMKMINAAYDDLKRKYH